MNVYLVIGEVPWSISHSDKLPHVRKFEKHVLKSFAEYEPKAADIAGTYLYPAFGMSVPADDAKFQKLLKELSVLAKASKPPVAIAFREFPTPQEAAHARYIKPAYYASYVDDDNNNEPLNTGMLLCKECFFPNLKTVADPFLVNRMVLKKYDVFHATAGVLVVRPRVLDLLNQAIGGQFEFGTVAIAKSKEKLTGDKRLFWVRPKETIGARARIVGGKAACPACKRVTSKWVGSTDNQVNASGPGVLDERFRVAHFGTGKSDVALIDQLTFGEWPVVVMSGALMTYLEKNGVKGMLSLKNKNAEVDCIFSQKGEPTLEIAPRSFGETARPAKAAQDDTRLAEAKKAAAALKDLPWDCSRDGHVYFHLSTPEFVVLDPMTGEEDSGGPYRAKNFKGAGVYRMPVSAIKGATGNRGVAVDSGTLVFVDNAFLPGFVDEYDWKKSMTKSGNLDRQYHQKIAEQIGTRFAICSPPPAKFKSEFVGDGFYSIDVKGITRMA